MSSLSSRSYARCTACDSSFYPQWRPEHKSFEDLCPKCLRISRHTARVDEHLYNPDQAESAWVPDVVQYSDDTSFLDGYLQDKQGIPDDLWSQDEYLEYGEGSFGDLSLFDNYE